ncbi:MAG: 23S rRNA (pseudouridine(1915)-N(3))-methyltransferase RlmH [Sulfobacillus thermotolerans]|nr:23S rRNA (pseudouridine(1915)-N(3))-methyltransferase RlmH [Sulfobacillus thermotolerans]
MARGWRMLTVGRPKDKRVTQLIDDYRQRLTPWMPVQWDSVTEIGYRSGQELETLEREGRLLLDKILPSDWVIILDIMGQSLNSVDLSAKMAQYYDQSLPVVFVVGGSLGLSARIKDRANWRWSLSPLTLPHALAQLLVMEQIYRAFSIIHHHPYHK